MKIIKIGDPLPDLNVEITGGKKMNLKGLLGAPVILYFYPKDDTPGCTKESQDFRDAIDIIKKKGAVVMGVSRDSLASHEKFISKYQLPFDLLSDPDEKLCQLFGVMKEKSMYGKIYTGIERSTFLFDKKGLLVSEWRKVKVPGHANEVLEAIS
jgi:thioredoxin-dependent peroxiredoxin